MNRRAFILSSVVSALGCRGKSRTFSAPPLEGVAAASFLRTRTREWSFSFGPVDHVVVVEPVPLARATRVVIALHGRGEALKDGAHGAWGWPSDYALLEAVERLHAPPLTKGDYGGFVTDEHLSIRNRGLSTRSYEGLCVVCPHVGDVDPHGPFVTTLASFILGELIPRVERELGIRLSKKGLGIDGVSMGGSLALRVGLLHPDRFSSVGAIQPAISASQRTDLTELAVRARARQPSLSLRLLTSDADYFRSAIEAQSLAWTEARISHDMLVLPGPHDYAFNRGPGSLELLAWHDAVLREN